MMARCEFDLIDGYWVCRNCDRRVLYKGHKLHAPCRVVCVHLGPAVNIDGIANKIKCGCSGKMKEKFHAVYRCDVHRRCLQSLKPRGKDLTAWLARKPESDLYHLCDGCEDFSGTDNKHTNRLDGLV